MWLIYHRVEDHDNDSSLAGRLHTARWREDMSGCVEKEPRALPHGSKKWFQSPPMSRPPTSGRSPNQPSQTGGELGTNYSMAKCQSTVTRWCIRMREPGRDPFARLLPSSLARLFAHLRDLPTTSQLAIGWSWRCNRPNCLQIRS